MSKQARTSNGVLAAALRKHQNDIVARWLERISARIALSPNHVFPTDELLNHVPLLIEGIAAYIETGGTDLDMHAPVVAKARELGALRHAQGFDAYQILKEYALLHNVMTSFFSDHVAEGEFDCPPVELLETMQLLAQAVDLIRQATAMHFLRLAGERVNDREETLRRFNRMVSHELKNHASAIRGASSLLAENWLDDAQRKQFLAMISENVNGLQHVLDNLEALSRLDNDTRQNRNVLLPHVVAESARQIREFAERRGVAIEIADDLPAIEVDAAAAELCLTNYLSNAIKYSDPGKSRRWVRVSAQFHPREATGRGGALTVRVEDNGIGVPQESRGDLFSKFFRANNTTITGAEGTGLGLSIVRETAESLGGSAWVEFPPAGGTTFVFSFPSRRDEDVASAGVVRRA